MWMTISAGVTGIGTYTLRSAGAILLTIVPTTIHHIGLARTCAGSEAEPLGIVAQHRQLHHFNGATGEPKLHYLRMREVSRGDVSEGARCALSFRPSDRCAILGIMVALAQQPHNSYSAIFGAGIIAKDDKSCAIFDSGCISPWPYQSLLYQEQMPEHSRWRAFP
jgi:hypothetical protein